VVVCGVVVGDVGAGRSVARGSAEGGVGCSGAMSCDSTVGYVAFVRRRSQQTWTRGGRAGALVMLLTVGSLALTSCSSGDDSATTLTSISTGTQTTVVTDPAALVRRIVERISADPARSASVDPAVGRELVLVQLRATGMTEEQSNCVSAAITKLQPPPTSDSVGAAAQQAPALDPSLLIPCIGIEGMSKLAASPPDLASVPTEQLRGLFDAVVRASLAAGGFAPTEVDCVASRVVTPADDAARATLLLGKFDPNVVEADIADCLSTQRLSELAK